MWKAHSEVAYAPRLSGTLDCIRSTDLRSRTLSSHERLESMFRSNPVTHPELSVVEVHGHCIWSQVDDIPILGGVQGGTSDNLGYKAGGGGRKWDVGEQELGRVMAIWVVGATVTVVVVRVRSASQCTQWVGIGVNGRGDGC
jgi:hypothetical protein